MKDPSTELLTATALGTAPRLPEDDLALVDENVAARFLDCTVSTLQKKRVSGGGPLFVRVGRLVRYTPRALRAYVVENVRRSTGDTGAG
jgi:hypothetical protein